MRNILSLGLGLCLAAGVFAQQRPATVEPAFGAGRPISGQYIVIFQNHVAQPAALAAQLAQQAGGQVLHTYGSAVKGFAARMPATAAAALANNPNVAYVEQDQTVSLSEAVTSPPTAQAGATWGLDRIDQRALALNSTYRYEYQGAGVYAFIIDTGILGTHQEFGGRVAAASGYTAIADGKGTVDCNGHGTHVSGTVGGSTYGVAKQVTLVPIRVLDCAGSGTNSGVIAGVNYAAASTLRPAVANMSLGGGFSSALNAAVAGAVSKGVTMVVAAGNSNADACTSSPASEPSAITVGATTSTDARASFSNFGSCLDIFAPGNLITSAWFTSTTATNTISGTSMASPHVTGVAALLVAGGTTAPADVAQALITQSTGGLVTSPGTGSPNRLLFSVASESAAATTVAFSAMSAAGIKATKSWKASVTVTVKAHDGANFGLPVAGASVSGSFAPGGTASCVTGSTGTCKLTSATISTTYATSQFTATGVIGSGMAYDSTKNAVTTITVARP